MVNPQKAKGDAFERAIRDHLAAAGFDVERTRAGYERDYGDLHVVEGRDTGTPYPVVIVQAKNRVDMSKLGAWLRATGEQRDHARAKHGVVVAKRIGIAAPGRQYAVLELDDLLALLREAGYATANRHSPGGDEQ